MLRSSPWETKDPNWTRWLLLSYSSKSLRNPNSAVLLNLKVFCVTAIANWQHLYLYSLLDRWSVCFLIRFIRNLLCPLTRPVMTSEVEPAGSPLFLPDWPSTGPSSSSFTMKSPAACFSWVESATLANSKTKPRPLQSARQTRFLLERFAYLLWSEYVFRSAPQWSLHLAVFVGQWRPLLVAVRGYVDDSRETFLLYAEVSKVIRFLISTTRCPDD